ncbi:MAG: hypothetical protein AAFV71_28590 [Cyanobacteria bacterium J06633_8]
MKTNLFATITALFLTGGYFVNTESVLANKALTNRQILLYKLSVQQEGLLQRIPIGTARIDFADAS